MGDIKKIMLVFVVAAVLSLVAVAPVMAKPPCTEFKLPGDRIAYSVINPGATTYFDVSLSGVPVGDYDISDGTWAGWCADYAIAVDSHTGFLYSSTSKNLPKKLQEDEQWDMINYILNNKDGAAYYEIQRAIWFFTDAVPGYSPGGGYPGADALIADALANGNGFCPAAGEIGAVVISSSNQFPGNSWATFLCYEPGTGQQVYALYAGEPIEVGTVTVDEVGPNLEVTYDVTGGWEISETHLHVAAGADCEDALDGISHTGSGNPKVGYFEYSGDHDPTVTSVTYQIPLAGLVGDFFAIAAHAIVVNGNQEETDWGDDEVQLIFIEVPVPAED
jgi:hypothetical protein